MKARFILTFLITIAVLYIPVISNFFKGINTMFHEGGHALMTLITDGRVKSISLFYNTEGVTESLVTSGIASFMISVSGYLTTSLVVLLFCFFWKKGWHRTIVIALTTFSVVSLVLWVRNPYGILWLVGMIGLCLLLFRIKEKDTYKSVTFILVAILFTQSFQSTLDILFLSYFTPEAAGDATNLSNQTHLPVLLFGILFFLQAVIFSLISLFILFKKETYVRRRT